MSVTGHSDSVMSVEWNDGTKLATGSYDKTIKIWAVGSAGTFECHAEGKSLASANDDHTVRI